MENHFYCEGCTDGLCPLETASLQCLLLNSRYESNGNKDTLFRKLGTRSGAQWVVARSRRRRSLASVEAAREHKGVSTAATGVGHLRWLMHTQVVWMPARISTSLVLVRVVACITG